ncbi:MAG: family 1 glycosylhydrolase [Spirochaetales bacterium]|nr:family 1 glycosylhydrolase [Spirochaetales bacterium]
MASKAKKVTKKAQSGRAKKRPARAPHPGKAARDFPRGFLFGAATSATQIDGGDRASDWYEFSGRPGNIRDGSSCLIAADHWNRYPEDHRILTKLGLNAYRMGVDWSRFESRPGEWDHQALDHLRGMLDSLRRKKIRTLLTINHFTLPAWWLARGGWTRRENLPPFLRFVEFLLEGVADLVDEYITINEPNVYGYMAYLTGQWPPGESGLRGLRLSRAVGRNMVLAHCGMVERIRKIHARKGKGNLRIGLAMHLLALEPYRPDNAMDVDRTGRVDFLFNHAFSDCLHAGRLLAPYGRGEKIFDGSLLDFFGINYYSRRIIAFDLFSPRRFFIREMEPDNVERSDLHWEIYPEGLYRVIRDSYARYGLPIRITENGIADASDEKRASFLRSHLSSVVRALEEGIPVEGYYHWSLLDNFEWAEGLTARFGLVAVDYVTQERSLRPSALQYRKIIQSGRLT